MEGSLLGVCDFSSHRLLARYKNQAWSAPSWGGVWNPIKTSVCYSPNSHPTIAQMDAWYLAACHFCISSPSSEKCLIAMNGMTVDTVTHSSSKYREQMTVECSVPDGTSTLGPWICPGNPAEEGMETLWELVVEGDTYAIVSSGNDSAVLLINSQQPSVYPRPHKINLANNLHGLERGFQGSTAPKCYWGWRLLGQRESVFFRGVAAGRLPMFHLVNDPPPMLKQAAPSGLSFFLKWI